MRNGFMVWPALLVALASCSLVYDSEAHIDSRRRDPREGRSCSPGVASGCGEGLFCNGGNDQCQACFHMEGVTELSLPASGGSIEGLFLKQGRTWVSESTEGTSVWLGYVQDQRVHLAVSSLESSGAFISGFETIPLEPDPTLVSVSSVDFCSAASSDYLALAGADHVELIRLPHASGVSPMHVDTLASAHVLAAVFASCGGPASPRLLLTNDVGVQVAKLTLDGSGELTGIIATGSPTSVQPGDAVGQRWSSDGMGHVLLFGAEHDSALLTPSGAPDVAASQRVLVTPVFDAAALAPTGDGVLLAWDQGDYTALQRMNCGPSIGCINQDWPAHLARTGDDIDQVHGVALTPSPDETSTMVTVESSSSTGATILAIRLLDDWAQPAHIPSWGTVRRYPAYEGEALPSLGGAVAATRAANVGAETDSLYIAYEVVSGGGEPRHSVEVRGFQSCGSGGRLGDAH